MIAPKQAAALARRALVWEVCLTPKPGLVDADNNGAHDDMDLAMFVRAAVALEGYFARCFVLGQRGAHLPPAEVLACLRAPGLAAEAVMYDVTGGVNTHKGAIFALGLLCAALGVQTQKGGDVDAAALCALCAQMCAGLCARELGHGQSYGQDLYRRYGVRGARGEAEDGYPSVLHHALPHYQDCLARGMDEQEAGVRMLVLLMATLRDTNALQRGGIEGAAWLQQQAAALHADFSLDGVRALDRELIARRISPGGCADLAAVSYFLHQLSLL